MVDVGKPFCVRGGECIGNVPTYAEANKSEWVYLGTAGQYELVTDGAWHEIDLLSVVGEDATCVLLRVVLFENAVQGHNILINSDGGGSGTGMYRDILVVSSYEDCFQCVIPLSVAKSIYYRTNVVLATIFLLGWYDVYEKV